MKIYEEFWNKKDREQFLDCFTVKFGTPREEIKRLHEEKGFYQDKDSEWYREDQYRNELGRDVRCAWNHLSPYNCEEDCDGDEKCLDYVPMWFSDCTEQEAINEIYRLMNHRRQYGERKRP